MKVNQLNLWYYVDFLSRPYGYYKAGPKPPKPAAAGGPAPDDVEMAGGDAVVENEGEGIVVEAVIMQEDGQPVHERLHTPKLKKKGTKCTRERDEVTAKVLNILEKMLRMMMRCHWLWHPLVRE